MIRRTLSARLRGTLPLAAAAALGACALPAPGTSPGGGDVPPPVRREFRAAWIASVANIDWPSRPGLPPEQQRAELVAMLDSAAALRLNAVVLQVRPAADALYPSPLEPWSEYLTGEQGRAPEPMYDPLEFAVAEAHRRGLELHAWFNPYRAFHPSQKSPLAPTHIGRTHPQVVKQYGKFLWMDPGEPAVQDRSIDVILDVVRRYDVDGVHIDDYFYPYPEKDSAGARIDFPDSASWARYQAGGGHLSRDDWRRGNVDRFVARMYREVKRAKPWVKVGISPFGIWRPGNPTQIRTGFDQYADIYADARRWMREGWGDYFSPQLYWRIQATPQSYPVLLRWWSEQNAHGRHLWPGLFTSQVIPTEAKWPAGEIVAQVNATRGNAGATGNIHFSIKAFGMDPDSLVEKLLAGPYAEPALVPASPWLSSARPGRPHATAAPMDSGSVLVRMTPGRGPAPMWWVVSGRWGAEWRSEVVPGLQREHALRAGPRTGRPEVVTVSAVSRVGIEGPRVVVHPSP
jgi:uncharacterized lipoprotein YddW (UPF0748 family)